MVKACRGYFKVSKLWYWKSYEGVENDLNICLNPLTTDKHVCDMVQVARANGNEVEIYAQHVVYTEEVEIVPLTNEEREELERAMEKSLRSMAKGGLTIEDEPVNIMEVDILSAEERNVVDCLVASVQNRVYNEEENDDYTQGMEEMTCDTQGNDEDNVGATEEENVGVVQGNEEVNVYDNEGGNITPETQPEETVTQANVTQQTKENVDKKGGRKGKEKQTLPTKRKRPVIRGSTCINKHH
jgi:hypothetical protein